MKKICPLMSSNVQIVQQLDTKKEYITNAVSCQQINCALWVHGYTIENQPISCCAFHYNAMKNSDGKYIV